MAYEITGKIKVIMDTQTFASGFSKREFVVTTEENYPQDICLEFLKDKVNILDNYKVGQRVTVSFDIRGREYNDRYFVNLNAWRIKAIDETEESNDNNPPADFIPEDTTDYSLEEESPF